MSASNTNLEKQRRRHIGPLVGISLVLLVVAVMFAGYLFMSVDTEDQPAPAQHSEQPAALPTPGEPATPFGDTSPEPSVIEAEPAPQPVEQQPAD